MSQGEEREKKCNYASIQIRYKNNVFRALLGNYRALFSKTQLISTKVIQSTAIEKEEQCLQFLSLFFVLFFSIF